MVSFKTITTSVSAVVLCSGMVNAWPGSAKPAPAPQPGMVTRVIEASKNGVKATPGAIKNAGKKSVDFTAQQYARVTGVVVNTFRKVGGKHLEKWAQENPKAFVAVVSVVSAIVAYETFTYGEQKRVKHIRTEDAINEEMKALCLREDKITGDITQLRHKRRDGYFSDNDAKQLKALKAKREEIRAMKLGLYRAQHALYQLPARVAQAVMELVQSILKYLPGHR